MLEKIVALAILILSILTVQPMLAAEDVTESTPARIAPAIGISSTPLSVGYRMSLSDHYSIDLLLHVPIYVSSSVDGGEELSGFEFGGLIGYYIPLRLEENVAFVIRPQVDFAYLMQSGELGSGDDIDRNVLKIRPGAFAGIEVFMEEIGIPDLNVQLGVTVGTEYTSESYSAASIDIESSSFKGPIIDSSPFGATVGIWWYF